MTDYEVESKFYLTRPELFIKRISELKAKLVTPRINEWNLRFDTPSGSLTGAGQVLRLRKDNRVRLTYKGPSALDSEVTSRKELEVETSDFDTTRKILESLGYQVSVMYEKFRTTWHYRDAEVVLDELPIGTFCEIEGQDANQIHNIANMLGLDWDHRISTSYLGIFSMLKSQFKWTAAHLTYEELAGVSVTESDFAQLQIFPADVYPN
jgi:adenylate cyclase, class 2